MKNKTNQTSQHINKNRYLKQKIYFCKLIFVKIFMLFQSVGEDLVL